MNIGMYWPLGACDVCGAILRKDDWQQHTEKHLDEEALRLARS